MVSHSTSATGRTERPEVRVAARRTVLGANGSRLPALSRRRVAAVWQAPLRRTEKAVSKAALGVAVVGEEP